MNASTTGETARSEETSVLAEDWGAVVADVVETTPGAVAELWPREMGRDRWAIDGFIPYDGHVLFAVIET